MLDPQSVDQPGVPAGPGRQFIRHRKSPSDTLAWAASAALDQLTPGQLSGLPAPGDRNGSWTRLPFEPLVEMFNMPDPGLGALASPFAPPSHEEGDEDDAIGEPVRELGRIASAGAIWSIPATGMSAAPSFGGLAAAAPGRCSHGTPVTLATGGSHSTASASVAITDVPKWPPPGPSDWWRPGALASPRRRRPSEQMDSLPEEPQHTAGKEAPEEGEEEQGGAPAAGARRGAGKRAITTAPLLLPEPTGVPQGGARHVRNRSDSLLSLPPASLPPADKPLSEFAGQTRANALDPSLLDPKRARRIIANRQSAHRSRMKKLQVIHELEQQVADATAEVDKLKREVVEALEQRRVRLAGAGAAQWSLARVRLEAEGEQRRAVLVGEQLAALGVSPRPSQGIGVGRGPGQGGPGGPARVKVEEEQNGAPHAARRSGGGAPVGPPQPPPLAGFGGPEAGAAAAAAAVGVVGGGEVGEGFSFNPFPSSRGGQSSSFSASVAGAGAAVAPAPPDLAMLAAARSSAGPSPPAQTNLQPGSAHLPNPNPAPPSSLSFPAAAAAAATGAATSPFHIALTGGNGIAPAAASHSSGPGLAMTRSWTAALPSVPPAAAALPARGSFTGGVGLPAGPLPPRMSSFGAVQTLPPLMSFISPGGGGGAGAAAAAAVLPPRPQAVSGVASAGLGEGPSPSHGGMGPRGATGANGSADGGGGCSTYAGLGPGPGREGGDRVMADLAPGPGEPFLAEEHTVALPCLLAPAGAPGAGADAMSGGTEQQQQQQGQGQGQQEYPSGIEPSLRVDELMQFLGEGDGEGEGGDVSAGGALPVPQDAPDQRPPGLLQPVPGPWHSLQQWHEPHAHAHAPPPPQLGPPRGSSPSFSRPPPHLPTTQLGSGGAVGALEMAPGASQPQQLLHPHPHHPHHPHLLPSGAVTAATAVAASGASPSPAPTAARISVFAGTSATAAASAAVQDMLRLAFPAATAGGSPPLGALPTAGILSATTPSDPRGHPLGTPPAPVGQGGGPGGGPPGVGMGGPPPGATGVGALPPAGKVDVEVGSGRLREEGSSGLGGERESAMLVDGRLSPGGEGSDLPSLLLPPPLLLLPSLDDYADVGDLAAMFD